jgi:hypothetical protein
MLQSDPSPGEFAGKTIDYAEAKEAYFKALRAEVPEKQQRAVLLNTGSEPSATLHRTTPPSGNDYRVSPSFGTAVL